MYKRRGAETGGSFQEAINAVNDAYERAGRACITRKAIPGKYLIDKGESRKGLSLPTIELKAVSGQARLAASDLKQAVKDKKIKDWRRFIPESKAEPDYGGVIAPEGRAIFYDAKTTRREALDFDNLHAHQIDFLERTARFGGVSGFLVEFSKHKKIYFLPIQLLARWRDESERKSLPYHFFAENLIPAPAGRGLLIFDYLAAVALQEERYDRDYSKFPSTFSSEKEEKIAKHAKIDDTR